MHQPPYHLLDNAFAGENAGLAVPRRRTSARMGSGGVPVCRGTAQGGGHSNLVSTQTFGLSILNLDRGDPPNYVDGAVPRDDAFNNNVVTITAYPRMPQIDVQCLATGFDPSLFPIYWRLSCRHVLGRHHNVGAAEGVGAYRYRGAVLVLEDQWQGQSSNQNFSLFRPTPPGPDRNVTAAYNLPAEDRIMGGHAILEVAARPLLANHWLRDYVHLRITGTNPARADVLRFVDAALSGRDANIIHAVKAIYAHEANFQQFDSAAQHTNRMRFRQHVGHSDPNQPDCNVVFDFPDDPANFPNASFDFGVGISQQTLAPNDARSADWWKRVSWDWRENAREGINEFLEKMRGTHQAGTTWNDWIWRAWRNYNGSGDQADDYADTLRAGAEGQQVSSAAAPAAWRPLVADVNATADRGAPPEWPPALTYAIDSPDDLDDILDDGP